MTINPVESAQVAGALGKGWATPFHADASGEASLEAGAAKIRQSVRLILGTRRGERVMRPDFGAGLEDFLFEPISTTTTALIRLRVETALVLWEPRIDVIAVSVDATDRRLGRLAISIDYRVRSTNTFYNLVYPFFLHEGSAT